MTKKERRHRRRGFVSVAGFMIHAPIFAAELSKASDVELEVAGPADVGGSMAGAIKSAALGARVVVSFPPSERRGRATSSSKNP